MPHFMAFSLPPEKRYKYIVGKLTLQVFPSFLHLRNNSHKQFPHYLLVSLHLTHSKVRHLLLREPLSRKQRESIEGLPVCY